MKKIIKIILISIVSLIIISTAAFFLYVTDYYKADDIALSVMASDQASEKITVDQNLTIFHTTDDSGSALIFYPGGKVDAMAYYPLLHKIAENGITCVLVKMPFHLAVFNVNAAEGIYDKLPNIKSWYIGGHSLGGAMASSYMAKHPDKVEGLLLLGAYIYGDIKPERALTIYGSNDMVLDKTKITYEENIVVIEGGNHAYYGNYGEQKGDGTATITREEQQDIAAMAIVDFMK
jgi:flagellar basal body-associated protein FliL